eukprot:gene21638-27678_t
MLGNGRLVLGDLGISKVLDGTMDFAQTCIGTPYYMSPEIFKNKPYSYKSDVWALGCVLYEMTTLNHAFDANSLNGLATKIVKGKYPPINAKYSKYLRELIGQMLQISPQQRPDLDQILRKPFIKKHIINFFTDIASRPSASLGEGTMIFKAAAGGPVNGAVSNDTNMISLRQQLHALDMTEAVGDALKPKSNPQDDEEAIRQAREQASALKREQEHKKMVEAALEKLRLEREIRKNAEQARPVGYAQGGRQQAGQAARRVEEAAAAIRPPAYRQPVAQQRVPSNSNLNGPNSEAARKEAAVRDRGINFRRPEEKEQRPSVGGGRAAAVAPEPAERAQRRQSFGEDRDRIVDRERKAADDRKKLEQDSRVRAEDRRREEVRAEAKAREEARLREEARVREEAAAQSKLEQVRAQAEAAAKMKRESQRERERGRQAEEFAQLKRDKLELDKRTAERDRMREEQRAVEKSRLEGVSRNNRGEQLDVMQDKLSHMNEQISQIQPRYRAEEKNEDLSAREKVNRRRQEKADREEKERLESLREAESENRRIRLAAQNQQRSQFHSGESNAPKNYVGITASNKHRTDSEDVSVNGTEERYEFDGAGRKAKSRMDSEELHDRLNDATKGKGNRYDSADVPNTGRNSVGHASALSDSGSEDEGSVWERGSHNMEEEEEDLHRREEELQAELNFATLRVNELKRTLQETKSYLGPRMPTRGKDAPPASFRNIPVVQADDDDGGEGEDDFYDEDDEGVFDEDDEEEEEESRSGKRYPDNNSNVNSNSGPRPDETVRRLRPQQAEVVSNNSGYALQDPPSPSGRLGDRIDRLRQRCTEALGQYAFGEAYHFLKQHEEESQGMDNGRDMNEEDYESRKLSVMRGILGEAKAHYMSLIEQLIFMEETHCG